MVYTLNQWRNQGDSEATISPNFAAKLLWCLSKKDRSAPDWLVDWVAISVYVIRLQITLTYFCP